MPFNGAGVFQSLGVPIFPAVSQEFILASYFNATMNDVFTGLSSTWTKDGQSAPVANLPMGGFKFQNAAAANTAGEFLVYDQQTARLKSITITEGLTVTAPATTITGTLAVTGAVSFGNTGNFTGLVSFSGGGTGIGNWNFQGASTLLGPTATLGNVSKSLANTEFVAAAITAAAGSIAGGSVSFPAAAYYAAVTFGGF